MTGHGSSQASSSPWQRMSAVGLLILAPSVAPSVAPAPEVPHEDQQAVEGARPGEHERPRERAQPREHSSSTNLEHDIDSNQHDNHEGENHD